MFLELAVGSIGVCRNFNGSYREIRMVSGTEVSFLLELVGGWLTGMARNRESMCSNCAEEHIAWSIQPASMDANRFVEGQ